MSNVTINEARALAGTHGKSGVVIFTFDEDGSFGLASYGKDRQTCQAMGDWADKIFKLVESGEMVPTVLAREMEA